MQPSGALSLALVLQHWEVILGCFTLVAQLDWQSQVLLEFHTQQESETDLEQSHIEPDATRCVFKIITNLLTCFPFLLLCDEFVTEILQSAWLWAAIAFGFALANSVRGSKTGMFIRSKKLLGTKGIAARSKDATRGSWHRY